MEADVYKKMHGVENSHWWFYGRRSIMSHIIQSLQLPSNPAILDAGCGTGANFSVLSKFGNVYGLEPNDSAVAYASQKYAYKKIYRGFLPDKIEQPDSQFDLITALDVVEHIDDDRGTLNTFYHLLKPKGRAIITVPAYQSLWSAHDEHHHHKRRYTKDTLASLVNPEQFSIRRISYYNTLLFPLAFIDRIIAKITGRKNVNNDLPVQPINQIFKAIFASEKHALTHFDFPFGLSLMVILEKKELCE